ncbi:conserved hypothetical protein [Ricinus communis]|uniref:VQ domain-containing protein n=1 Tax=Ricinus communis TaxID=3988 RepID=B9SXI6_RICCO|nr:conserved hypothetical protein [Ricinus communis]|eukprot:XP_002530705.1 VQ motif-containing protein 17 [Ricinus communis]
MEEVMKMMMKKQQQQVPCVSSHRTTTSSPLSMHKDSQTISKVKPKIRIIHIFAPEIIKTDVANFRELVQRLTGKPAADQKGSKSKIKKPRRVDHHHQHHHHHHQPRTNLPAVVTKKVEIRSGLGMVKKEEEEEEAMWNCANSGGFLAGFADLDGFIQELDEFSMLPMETNHMHGFGESQLA